MRLTLRASLLALVALVVLATVPGCKIGARDAQPVTIAYAPFESLGLLFVAEDQGLFAEADLEVTTAEYDTGVGALEAVLAGEADVAMGTAEFPLVRKAFERAPVSAFATVDRPDFIYLIGRSDRGIEAPTDLAGKRVGTTAGSVAEFYLGRYLELNGMTVEDITLVDLRTPDEWRAAIAEGDVDAVVLAQPEASIVRDSLGTNATFLPVQGNQPAFALAVAGREWIAANPDTIEKLLTALAEAEEFVRESPAEARAIIQARLKLDSAYMDAVWAQNDFALTLDQALVLAMEDEARWMIRSGITTETEIPDFAEYIHAGGLKAVSPEAVNVAP